MAWRLTRRKHIFGILAIISTFVILIFASPLNFNTRNSLYGPEDKVVLLNVTTIKKSIFNSERAWFVEFFSSWCGHCIHFAPKWKKFADDLWDWRNVVAVAGIDCADDNNTATCREFEIMGYPTLRFFGPQAPEFLRPTTEKLKEKDIDKTLNTGLTIEKSETMSKLKKRLIDELEHEFPNLLRFSGHSGATIEDLWSEKELQFEGQPSEIVVIYEGESSYVGREVALRLSLYKFIKVYRFSTRNEIYTQMKLDGWPAVGHMKKEGIPEIIELGNKNLVDTICQTVLKSIGIDEKPELPLPDLKQDQGSNPDASKNEVTVANDRDVVSMDDLLHALRDGIHKEIALVKTISGPKLEALEKFLRAVANYLPVDRRETKIFLEELNQWVNTKQEIQSSDFLDKLEHMESSLHPWDIDLNQWDECRGTVPGRRGYTCGLWRLFHALTLVAVQKNAKDNVLDAIHGYVKEFFGCSECRKHFTGMVARDNALQLESVASQALWLWKAHNEVNLRLKGTLSEDPGYPKQRYPSKALCPECYDTDEKFNEGKVLDYLIRVYSNPQRSQNTEGRDERAVPPYARARRAGSDVPVNLLMSGAVQSNKSPQRWLGFFSVADIGLFMIVYLSVACLLLLGYVHFKMVGRRWCNPTFVLRKIFVQSVV